MEAVSDSLLADIAWTVNPFGLSYIVNFDNLNLFQEKKMALLSVRFLLLCKHVLSNISLVSLIFSRVV
jgi:hypothetical protein